MKDLVLWIHRRETVVGTAPKELNFQIYSLVLVFTWSYSYSLGAMSSVA